MAAAVGANAGAVEIDVDPSNDKNFVYYYFPMWTFISLEIWYCLYP